MATLSPIAAELYQRFGRTFLDIVEAGQQIGYRSKAAVRIAKSRGKFPLHVVDCGGRQSVSILEIARFVETGLPAQAVATRKVGRPSKSDQISRRLTSENKGA